MIALKFGKRLGCAVALRFSADALFAMPGLPRDSLTITLALAGRIGGSVTIMVDGSF